MRLEQRADRMPAAGDVAQVADSAQLFADRPAVAVAARPGILLVEQARVNTGRDHRRGEARTLFVGPDHGLHRRLGNDSIFVQCPQYLECREHAVDTVELAAVRLCIEMAAGDDRRQIRIPPFAPREDIAHVVDLDTAADIPAPVDEQIAALAVLVGQRETAGSTVLPGPDLGHRHDAVPEPTPVDAQPCSLTHDPIPRRHCRLH